MRLDVRDGGDTWYCELEHDVMLEQTRDDVGVGVTSSNCRLIVQFGGMLAQVRSVVAERGDTWYWVVLHTVTLEHARSDVDVEAIVSY